jgi:hypothetical protein
MQGVVFSTTVALSSMRVSASVSDPPAVAAAYVYLGQSSLGVRAKVAAGINPQGKCNCSIRAYPGRPCRQVMMASAKWSSAR